MQYTIDTGEPAAIRWGAKGAERVLQNVINLINTYTYEIAYARTVGLAREYIDKQSSQASTIVANDIRGLISLREPRARVEEVKYLGVSSAGNMRIQVVVYI